MVRVRDLGVGFTMKTQIANGFVAMRDRKTEQRERERDLCVREREVGGCDIIKQSGSEGCDIIKLSGSSSFLKLNLNK